MYYIYLLYLSIISIYYIYLSTYLSVCLSIYLLIDCGILDVHPHPSWYVVHSCTGATHWIQ
jgi:hypothetical protein